MATVSLHWQDSPFNSPLETGFRALIVLDAAYPRAYDLNTLVLFDHLVVHSADVDGPPSLHPDVPQRSGELLVRRTLIEAGLTLMRRKHLIAFEHSQEGFLYRASDDAIAIVEHARSPYAVRLRERAAWLISQYGSLSDHELRTLIVRRLGRWKAEFQRLANAADHDD